MAEITVRQHIMALPEEVFRRASDFAGAAQHIAAIRRVEMLGEGPVGVGTRFRETRVLFGKEASETMEVTAFDAPNSYSLRCENHGCRVDTEFRFTPSGNGTDVMLTFRTEPLTLGAKVMGFLMRPVQKSLLKETAKDLADLKHSLEGTAGEDEKSRAALA